MVNGTEFVQWYYLIYLVPGGIALVLLLLSALGGGMHHPHAGSGHHFGHSAGHSAGHADGAAHGHHGHAAPAAQSQAPHPPPGQTAARTTARAAPGSRSGAPLAFFGLGRVPAPLVWGSGLLGWGVFGFWGTQFWQQHLHGGFWLPALGTALIGAAVIEKATVEAAARLLPRDETFALASVDLCGLTGTVAFPVDATRGRVHVYDAHGTMHDVSARTGPGSALIARGRTVLVADYDAARDQVVVEETG